MVPKGTWVRIRRIVLNPEDRAATLPEDTRRTPLVLWVKGDLEEDAEVGANVRVRTVTGRIEEGVLDAVAPSYRHDFGAYVPELAVIDGIVARALGRESR